MCHFNVYKKNIQIHYNSVTNDTLEKLRISQNVVPTYFDNCKSPLITPDTYRLYGRKLPANEAITSFIDSMIQ